MKAIAPEGGGFVRFSGIPNKPLRLLSFEFAFRQA